MTGAFFWSGVAIAHHQRCAMFIPLRQTLSQRKLAMSRIHLFRRLIALVIGVSLAPPAHADIYSGNDLHEACRRADRAYGSKSDGYRDALLSAGEPGRRERRGTEAP